MTKTYTTKYKCCMCKKPILGAVVIRKKDDIAFHMHCVDIERDNSNPQEEITGEKTW